MKTGNRFLHADSRRCGAPPEETLRNKVEKTKEVTAEPLPCDSSCASRNWKPGQLHLSPRRSFCGRS